MDRPDRYASDAALVFARVMEVAVKIGFIALIASFAIYVTGVLPPLIPFEQLPTVWHLSAREYVAATHMPSGWGWMAEIGKGDMLNLVPIAFLAGASALCCLAVLPILARRREKLQLAIVTLQIVVLVVAASDLIRVH